MLLTILILVAVIMSLYTGIKLALDKKAFLKERILGVSIIIFIFFSIAYTLTKWNL